MILSRVGDLLDILTCRRSPELERIPDGQLRHEAARDGHDIGAVIAGLRARMEQVMDSAPGAGPDPGGLLCGGQPRMAVRTALDPDIAGLDLTAACGP
jgi:hypothetical protein